MKDHKPTRVQPQTHLTHGQLTKMWLEDIAQTHPETAQRYESNLVVFPMSRYDLIEYYTKMDLKKGNLR